MRPKLVWVIDQFGSPSTSLRNPNNEIIEKYFELEVWDIRGMKKSWYKKNQYFRYENDVHFTIRYPHTIEEVRNELQQQAASGQQVAFLIGGKLSYWNRPFIRELEKNKLPYFFRRNRAGIFDSSFFKKNGLMDIRSYRLKMINLAGKLSKNNPLFVMNIKGPDLVFAGTRSDLEQINYPYSGKNLVYTHTKDYDNYLLLKDRSVNEEKDTIVYMDQYLPFHIETRHFNIDPKKHYDNILAFLEQLRQFYNKKIVFAAHPVADREKMKKYVPEAITEYGKTTQLVNQSFFCITFNSNSGLMALITHTPIILIDQPTILPSHFILANRVLENIFDTKSVNIEAEIHKPEIDTLLNAQKAGSLSTFNRFIKHEGTPDKPEFDIICENIYKYLSGKNG